MDVSAIQSSLQPQTQAHATSDQIAERRQLVLAAKTINESEVLGAQNEVVFVMDRVSNRAIMRVVNRTTQEVVMQVPPEYLLQLAKELGQKS